MGFFDQNIGLDMRWPEYDRFSSRGTTLFLNLQQQVRRGLAFFKNSDGADFKGGCYPFRCDTATKRMWKINTLGTVNTNQTIYDTENPYGYAQFQADIGQSQYKRSYYSFTKPD